MKKAASLILIIVYFTFSAGATVRLHYCMGEYSGFSFSSTKNQVCSKCGMSKRHNEKNCCDDVVVTAKISDAHVGTQVMNPPEIYTFDFRHDFPRINTTIVANTLLHVSVQKQPPGDRLSLLYLHYRNFRI